MSAPRNDRGKPKPPRATRDTQTSDTTASSLCQSQIPVSFFFFISSIGYCPTNSRPRGPALILPTVRMNSMTLAPTICPACQWVSLGPCSLQDLPSYHQDYSSPIPSPCLNCWVCLFLGPFRITLILVNLIKLQTSRNFFPSHSNAH